MRLTVLAVSDALALASCSQAPPESVSVELQNGEKSSFAYLHRYLSN